MREMERGGAGGAGAFSDTGSSPEELLDFGGDGDGEAEVLGVLVSNRISLLEYTLVRGLRARGREEDGRRTVRLGFDVERGEGVG